MTIENTATSGGLRFLDAMHKAEAERPQPLLKKYPQRKTISSIKADLFKRYTRSITEAADKMDKEKSEGRIIRAEAIDRLTTTIPVADRAFFPRAFMTFHDKIFGKISINIASDHPEAGVVRIGYNSTNNNALGRTTLEIQPDGIISSIFQATDSTTKPVKIETTQAVRSSLAKTLSMENDMPLTGPKPVMTITPRSHAAITGNRSKAA